MPQAIFRNIINFVLLALIQTLVLNQIQFLGFVNPYVYLLFIISQPIKQPRWLTLILAFALGLTIDIFSNTLGIHAFATVLVAYLREYIIRIFISLDDGVNAVPNFHTFGVAAYIKYLAAMVVIHHFALFFLEAFSFTDFWLVLLRIIVSSFFTILIILGVRTFFK
ncbi:MAG: rod shape-determining protein MreD [Paludibacter sp.]|jgi:rod shape-determining protein MreD|nr:rod shape-determining protein MreD [Paludibacter sp.]